ncbi:hypothetical protein ACNAN0_00945 [Agrilactobacillus fermenti]|uniref:hypothetical protein n=1 Tax=Agrilactobacillus fermenti TaxID=2586909 RepID=UPI003A5C1FFF
MAKKISWNIFWGLLVFFVWLYQLFWPLVWVPLVGHFWGSVILFAFDGIILAFAIRATVKGYGRN